MWDFARGILDPHTQSVLFYIEKLKAKHVFVN